MMGGFEGGDEAGFWDDALPETHRYPVGDASPSITVPGPGDTEGATITFVVQPCDGFCVSGYDKAVFERACHLLVTYTHDEDIECFFREHHVRVSGGKGVAARDLLTAFAKLTSEVCGLALGQQEIERLFTVD